MKHFNRLFLTNKSGVILTKNFLPINVPPADTALVLQSPITKFIMTSTHGPAYWHRVGSSQCDQIWRIFATLAMFLKSLNNF